MPYKENDINPGKSPLLQTNLRSGLPIFFSRGENKGKPDRRLVPDKQMLLVSLGGCFGNLIIIPIFSLNFKSRTVRNEEFTAHLLFKS